MRYMEQLAARAHFHDRVQKPTRDRGTNGRQRREPLRRRASGLCITQSDVTRRDNFPNTLGEVGPGVTGPLLAKISCADQSLPQAGLTLPVH
jgi:hypothetical protein